eukprot:Cvel_31936.t1-p1 / transcript=Cvel_31936.t1 / gene=Cvel_31936 / organism=Chromera_velia_CCMP2878 / gene_product=Uroporphyrinogen decarboxylase, putative / transcript_product=Uroporphyrinogen decarboxylase, putative / location=Cvel_scaffold4855:2061-4046(-) / protein_length=402 / sequence_SO=supercontig / SO=protein_coding / is_pseudo=false
MTITTDLPRGNQKTPVVAGKGSAMMARPEREEAQSAEHDLLLRAAKGEQTHRAPVWLMRQAGRYMEEFRKYSDVYPFRQRSETPNIAVELSLQPFRAFGTDGVIMFSDILTPFPAFGIDFDVVKGKGPVFPEPVRTKEDVEMRLRPVEDFGRSLPFVGETLRRLRKETEGRTTLIGFVGSPFTLAAYACEGGGSKECLHMKEMMLRRPETARKFLSFLAEQIGRYVSFQVQNGAQLVQVFESWAHHLGADDWETWAKPYAERVASVAKQDLREAGYDCESVPLIYFANGGSGYLERQRGLKGYNMVCVDWGCGLEEAVDRLGCNQEGGVGISGNVDPAVLRVGSEDDIRQAVRKCIAAGSRSSNGFVLNLGHGVKQGTPEEAVGWMVDEAKRCKFADVSSQS